MGCGFRLDSDLLYGKNKKQLRNKMRKRAQRIILRALLRILHTKIGKNRILCNG